MRKRTSEQVTAQTAPVATPSPAPDTFASAGPEVLAHFSTFGKTQEEVLDAVEGIAAVGYLLWHIGAYSKELIDNDELTSVGNLIQRLAARAKLNTTSNDAANWAAISAALKQVAK